MRRVLLFISLFLIFPLSGHSDSHKKTHDGETYPYGMLPAAAQLDDALFNYARWKKRFIAQEDGIARVRWVNPEQTTSRGIGTGMLLAVNADDPVVFDGLWSYYQRYSNDNGLMHAKIDINAGVVSYNAVSAADIDACMALIAATNQWPERREYYQSAAQKLLMAIRKHEIDSARFVLKPTDRSSASIIISAEYFSPAYFNVFSKFSGEHEFWDAISKNCYSLLNQNLIREKAIGGLISDRISLDGAPVSASGELFHDGKNYYYDAASIPFRVALDYLWTGNPMAKAYLDRCNEFVTRHLGGPENIVDGYTKHGIATGTVHNSSFVGPLACAATTGYDAKYLDKIYMDLLAIDDEDSFYSQSAKTLSLFLLNGAFRQPVELSGMPEQGHHHALSIENQDAYLASPNPFSGQTHIFLPEDPESYPLEYSIVDERGVLYESARISSPATPLIIGKNLASGSYFIQLRYASLNKVVRLYKK